MTNSPSSPKNTYWNLPLEKQDRIIQEIVQEFAVNGYQRASLNVIARRLGIAKGSFYQYFDNKEAIFLFVFDQFTELVKKTLAQAAASSAGNDIFTTLRQALLSGVRFIDQYPLYYNLYLRVLYEHDVPRREELIHKVRLFTRDFFGPLLEQGKSQGQLHKDLSIETAGFILDAVFDRFLQGYTQSYMDGGLGLAGKGTEEIERDVDRLLEVLKKGFTA